MKNRTGVAIAVVTALVAIPLWAGGLVQSTLDPPATITDNTGTFTACQTITVVPAVGEDVVGDVNVRVTSSHSWVGDLTIRVTSPDATVLTILNRPGRLGTGAGNLDNFVTATPILYDNTAASGVSAEAVGTACAGGVINGTAGCEDNYIPAPDTADTPIAGVGTDLADFTGDSRDGVWQLCVADSAIGDTGTLTSWTLEFLASTPVDLLGFDVE